jgi:hypothetical protein
MKDPARFIRRFTITLDYGAKGFCYSLLVEFTPDVIFKTCQES